ncbi:MAG TPA: dihydroxyacetone kinase phosphoryl donor subunit DhaM [Euzebyales bacterium]|nr:dihydroxyacetone kinase phosphoryl donor subunit DhaM [Euzebyales bacterium]
MVGLVLVSHSDRLVEGLRDLVAQMEPEVPFALAGGTDDGELGTSLELVMAAIDDADSGDGAVILYDLGSAEMTAESALEFLDYDQRERVLVVDAPLVEGAIAAASTAGGGANLGQVAAAAARVCGPAEPAEEEDTAELGQSVELELTNVGGLHARPAGQISRAVRGLDAQVRVERADTGEDANAASTLSLVALGAGAGTTIIVRAGGPDGQQALARVRELIADRFDEPAAEL